MIFRQEKKVVHELGLDTDPEYMETREKKKRQTIVALSITSIVIIAVFLMMFLSGYFNF